MPGAPATRPRAAAPNRSRRVIVMPILSAGPQTGSMRSFPVTLPALSRELVFRNLGKSPSNVLRNLTRNLQSLTAAAALSSFHRYVFVGRGVREQRDPGEPGLADARADAVDEGELPDRREDRALDHQL